MNKELSDRRLALSYMVKITVLTFAGLRAVIFLCLLCNLWLQQELLLKLLDNP